MYGSYSAISFNVLVACEFSGVVRDQFIRIGANALSCDLLPTDAPGPHYQGDVKDIIHYPWHLMIAHPPCTHTSASGAKHFNAKWANGSQAYGVSFFMFLVNQPHIPFIAIEHPVSILSTLYRKPDQIIQPYEFGHGETKATCLWLKGLPLLKPTRRVKGRRNKIFKSPDSKGRWKKRSKTYTGIARAMAEQWGNIKGK